MYPIGYALGLNVSGGFYQTASVDVFSWFVFWTGKRNDEEDAKEKLFTYATHVPVVSYKVSISSRSSFSQSLNMFFDRASRQSL